MSDDEELESYGADMGQKSSTGVFEWVIVDGNRLLVAALLTAAVSVLLLGLNAFDVIAFQNANSVTRVASGMIAGTFSLVTLVVSINQMILSQEFSSAGEARDQLDGVMDFREDVESLAKVPASPASPSRLIDLIVVTIHERADDLEESVSDNRDADCRDAVSQYVAGIDDSTQRIHETLKETEFGTFNAVSAAINYNDAWQIYAGRHLYGRYEDSFSEETSEAFERLLDALRLFDVAREQFKTTYLQRELTQFSRQTLYCGVPSVLSAIVLGLVYADISGSSLAPDLLPFVAVALITVVVSPLALLAAYILRTATVAHRTASIGPMLPQKDPEEGPFDVSYGESEE
ncbi:hypothetical protein [Halalkalicoccus ordinarius]|uniref:hypothetical protein n=1 Tax=Halalkalicoccus ordinarius TaxID=3116651 RepID=UPI00300F7917